MKFVCVNTCEKAVGLCELRGDFGIRFFNFLSGQRDFYFGDKLLKLKNPKESLGVVGFYLKEKISSDIFNSVLELLNPEYFFELPIEEKGARRFTIELLLGKNLAGLKML